MLIFARVKIVKECEVGRWGEECCQACGCSRCVIVRMVSIAKIAHL